MRKGRVDTEAIKKYSAMEKAFAAGLKNQTGIDAWNFKWNGIEQLNRAYDKLTPETRHFMHYGKGGVREREGKILNEALMRSRMYKKEIEKGVRGSDLIQPHLPDGKYNPDFFEHHGDKAFEKYPEQRREIKRELG